MNERLQMDFSLLRMILIDSYAPGGETIINLDGGAVITGDNGSGKTSLIRLVPIFFGENPGRINTGTDGFIDFYLGRTTSYIIFEYQRRGVVCQAVLTSGQNQTYTYRFIRSGYDISHYLLEDGKTLVTNTSLGTHLKTLKVDASRALVLSEYRSIIQGKHAGGKDSAMRGYVSDYAFTAGNHRLDHIDKIVSGMFKRQADFRDFLRMVVRYISDDDHAISLAGDRAKMVKWPEEYRAYQEVMSHQDKMPDVVSLGIKLETSDAHLGTLHARMKMLIQYHDSQFNRLKQEHLQASADLLKNEEEHKGRIAKIKDDEFKAGGQALQAEQKVAALHSQMAEYEKADIAGKAELVAKIESNKELMRSAEKRKENLLGDKSKMEQGYDKLKRAAEIECLEAQKSGQQQLDAITAEFNPRFADVRKRHDQLNAKAREAAETQLKDKRHERDLVIANKARWQAACENPVADPAAEEALQKKQKALEKSRGQQFEKHQFWQQSEASLNTAVKTFERHETAAGHASAAVRECERTIASLLASANPPEGSLLRYLREQRCQEWPHDIAKVINETLLLRTDLSPSLMESAISSLYGISLDLSRIETPAFGDEIQLAEVIQGKRDHLARLNDDHAKAQVTLQAAADARTEAIRVCNQAELAAQSAANEATAIGGEVKSCQRAVDESRRTARDMATAHASEAGRQLGELDKAIDRVSQELVSALDAIAENMRKEQLQLDKEVEDRRQLILGAVKQAEEHRTAQNHKLEDECQKALQAEGIDMSALGQIDGEIRAIGLLIKDALAWAERVSAWHLWLRDEWPQVAKLQEQAGELRKTEQHHNKRAKKVLGDWELHRENASARIKDLLEGAMRSDRIGKEASDKLHRFDEYPPNEDVLKGHYDTSWTIETLAAAANKAFSDRKIAEGDLKSRVYEIKASFRHGVGTAVEQYFETISNQMKSREEDARLWVTPLQEWYGSRHEEYRRILLIEAKKLGGLVNVFYAELTEFDRKIRDFNQRMSRALTSTIVFERISSIDIRFISTITEKAYWKPISRFIENHKSWLNSIGQDLPPASFSEGLNDLLQHWDIREGLKAERLSLLDVKGEVTENGRRKMFRDGSGLMDLSSHGLSYLILTTICVSFLHMIRGDTACQITLAVDELLDLDKRNISILVKMLHDNGIDLVSACPAAEVDVMLCFPNRYMVTREGDQPVIAEAIIEDEAAYA
jgi:hypothetical protein